MLMLRLPLAHFRPDASYGGRYMDDAGHSARRRHAEELAKKHGLQLLDDWAMPTLGLDCYVVQYPKDAAPERLIALLESDPEVQWVQPVARFRGMDGGDALYPVQPGAKFWRLSELHQLTTGRNVTIAVIDSGIDSSHPDLAGQIALSQNFVGTSPLPAEPHGTAVAGIIAARTGNGGIVGVAPQARLMSLRACWETASHTSLCDSFTLGKALNYAILQRAKVINLSLAGPQDRLLARLLDAASAQGIAVVGALDPLAATQGFPASHPAVLAIAAQPGIGAVPAGALLAPGKDIPATVPGGRWQFVSGNSYATAHVSGMVALLLQLRPNTAPAQLRQLLHPIATHNAATIDACATVTRLTGACSCSCALNASRQSGSGP
ncbi:S8 family serine peptidase [Oxalobacteraceae bacterium]|nr:S8 family serine peptidase [Oxalobacteraceae bacterium]